MFQSSFKCVFLSDRLPTQVKSSYLWYFGVLIWFGSHLLFSPILIPIIFHETKTPKNQRKNIVFLHSLQLTSSGIITFIITNVWESFILLLYFLVIVLYVKIPFWPTNQNLKPEWKLIITYNFTYCVYWLSIIHARRYSFKIKF